MSHIDPAQIEWLEDGSPRSLTYGDIYFSADGGPAESEHVFLAGNRLSQRWQSLADRNSLFTLGEVGFGTGLNFLLTWQLLETLQIQGLRLHYIAFERHPLDTAALNKAHALWPQLSAFSSRLNKVYLDHTRGLHRYLLTDQLVLDLCLGDARESLAALAPLQANCWFLDGFSPDRNPELWGPELAAELARHSAPEASLSSYSVAGAVRRNLQAAGFLVEKKPGFGRKRAMLTAQFLANSTSESPGTHRAGIGYSAQLPSSQAPPPDRHAIIIGAGLAGCSTAYSLSRRGWRITLIEGADEIAAGASGNPQAILQSRLYARPDIQADFYVHGVLFAHRQYCALQSRQDIGWQTGGVLTLDEPDSSRSRVLFDHTHHHYGNRLLKVLSRQQASELAGVEIAAGALWQPYGGWLVPAALCRAYLDRIPGDNLSCLLNSAVDALSFNGSLWRVTDDEQVLASAPVVILCNGYQASTFDFTNYIPLIPVRGQSTLAAASAGTRALRLPVLGSRSICPEQNGRHTIGATYDRGSEAIETVAADDSENLLAIEALFAGSAPLELQPVQARAAVRTASRDYFPVVGAVPNYDAYVESRGALTRNARARVEESLDCWWNGLFINSGHGSHGLASCPLAAELLASLINHESLPLPRATVASLSPARFIRRALKRQEIPVPVRPGD